MNKVHTDIVECLKQLERSEWLHWGEDLLADFLDKPCIYFLMQDKECVYIGKTKSLMKRLYEHRYGGGVKAQNYIKTFNNFAYVFCDVSIQDELEEILVSCFQPSLNIRKFDWKIRKISEYLGYSMGQFRNQYLKTGEHPGMNMAEAINILETGIDKYMKDFYKQRTEGFDECE